MMTFNQNLTSLLRCNTNVTSDPSYVFELLQMLRERERESILLLMAGA